MTRKRRQIVDKWELDDYEPSILEQYDKLLSLKINYTTAYRILAAIIDELGIPPHDVYITFARRNKRFCGMCRTLDGVNPGTYIHKIMIYKGYHTLGVLLHEYAHAVVHQKNLRYKQKNMHGIVFKGWFVFLSRLANMLYMTEPELFKI